MTDPTPRDRVPAYRRVFVAEETLLGEVAEEMSGADAVGVDIEMGQRVVRRPGGVQEWVHSLALIQLAAGDLSAAVDPLRCSIDALGPLMAGPARKVFLGGGQDVTLLEKAGLPIRNIVDVGEIALALLGRREDGMAALADRIFGLHLDKTVRRADWLIRPLNPALLSYAHLDAELTLGIYRWFQREHPEIVALHERVVFDPTVPDTAPEWIQEALRRPSIDALAIALSHGVRPQEQGDELTEILRPLLREAEAPRLINRLLRLGADLELHGLLPDVLPYASSRSSLIRASAARAIGALASVEVGEAILCQLLDDPIGDVKKAAEGALRELKSARPAESEPEEEPTSAFGNDALAALEALRAQLENESN